MEAPSSNFEHSGLKIVYGGDLSEGSTSHHRFLAMQRLGLQVYPVQIHFTGQRTLFKAVRRRLPLSPEISAINQSLFAAVKTQKPDIVWIDKGTSLWPETIRQIKESCRALVHYNPDDPYGRGVKGWDRFLDGLPEYDLHFVARDVNIDEYLQAGARHAVRFLWAYEPTVHQPYPIDDALREKIGAPVGFIGTYEQERAQIMQAIAAAGIKVRIWGNDWQKLQDPHPNLQIQFHGPVQKAYSQTLSATDISLGFLRISNRDLSTTRSIEIPACGSMLLGERTCEHQELFAEGREADFFTSVEECIRKIRYYLDHPEKRKAVADAGRQRCIDGGYSNDERLKSMIRSVVPIMRNAKAMA